MRESIQYFFHARNTYVSYYYITIHRRTQSDWQSRLIELNIRRSKILESKDPLIRRFSDQRKILSSGNKTIYITCPFEEKTRRTSIKILNLPRLLSTHVQQLEDFKNPEGQEIPKWLSSAFPELKISISYNPSSHETWRTKLRYQQSRNMNLQRCKDPRTRASRSRNHEYIPLRWTLLTIVYFSFVKNTGDSTTINDVQNQSTAHVRVRTWSTWI